MRTALLILGILALLIGLLWIGQGTGIVTWPRSSFMISQIQWAWYGVALAVVGVVLIWRGRR
jgi:membrane protein implicated in regulation of membrane protease activity